MLEEKKQYRVAICDDEKICASELTKNLRKLGYDFEVVYFRSGEELLDSDLDYFIIFLDIEMEGMNGFAVAEQLQLKSFSGKVMLTTCHVEDFAEAFRWGVFRYLVKPIQLDKLREAVEAVGKGMKKNENLLLTYGGKMNALKLREIVCVRASKDESIFGDIHGRETISNKPLAYWKDNLPRGEFLLIHKSYMIALQHIERTPRNGKIKMKGIAEELPVSRKCMEELREKHMKYMKEQGDKLL